MSEVVSVIQPFVLEQQVYVFEGTEIIKQFSVRLMDMPEEILAYCHANNVYNVKLRGDAHFVAKIKHDTEAKEMTQYGVHKLHINAT